MSLLLRPFTFDSFDDNELITMRRWTDILQDRIKYKDVNGGYIYEFNVAGIPKEKINIILDRMTYTIKIDGKIDGKIDEVNDDDSGHYTFSRSINQSVVIPKDSDLDNIRSELANGILRVTVKKHLQKSSTQTITIN
jgi:HSP20 family molecular chaperone IbpA